MAGKFDPKKLVVEHGEKGLLGIAVVLVLLAVVTTNWKPYSGRPEEILAKVSDAQRNLDSGQWPEEERAKFQLPPEQQPKRVVDAALWEAIPLALYESSVKPQPEMIERREPLREPKLYALESPIADSGFVLVEVQPKSAELAMADDTAAGATASAPAAAEPRTAPDAFTSDEFSAGPMGTPGAPAGAAAGAHGGSSMPSFYAPDLYGPGGGHMAAGGGGHSAPGGRGRGGAGERSTGSMPGSHSSMTPSAHGGSGALGSGSGMAMREVEAKGFHYVSVRMVFPIREQITEIGRAIHKPYAEASQFFEIIDFDLERQTVPNGADPAASPWEPVDVQVALDVLNEAAGFAPDVISGAVSDSAITMPLPLRVFGVWRSDVTHPRIEKFTLTDEQIAQELEFSRRLLQKAFESAKAQAATAVEKGGFNGVQFDSRRLQSEMTGMETLGSSAGGGHMGSGMSSGHMGSSMRMSPLGGSSRPLGGAMGNRGTANKSFDELVNELARSGPDGKPDDKLRDWITQRISVEGELLLFRYVDFNVEPGKTYRYRARLTLRNPNFGRKITEAGGVPTVVQGETRTAEQWSDPTPPVTVEPDVHYFVDRVRPVRSRMYDEIVLSLFQRDPKLGTIVHNAVTVHFGQSIGDTVKTTVIDPAKSAIKEEEPYKFHTEDQLVDSLPIVAVDSKDHPDLKVPAGSRGDLLLTEELLVVKDDRSYAVLDPVTQARDLDYQNRRAKAQDEYFAYLKNAAANVGAGSTSDPAYRALSEQLYGSSSEMSSAPQGMSGPQGRNSLRKKAVGGRGAAAGGTPGGHGP